jgi:hypothetical protein
MKYIHLDCIRQWLKGKVTTRQNGCTASYYWRRLNCELCKEPLPSSFVLNGRTFELIELPRPPTPYIILEANAVDSDGADSMHVISVLDTEEIFIVRTRQGRGHESQVRVTDISASRVNSSIRLVKDAFYLKDNHSKFGTLVLVRRPIHIPSGSEISSTD